MALLFSILVYFIITSGQLLAQSHSKDFGLSCSSQKLLKLNRSDQAAHPSEELIISQNGKILSFNHDSQNRLSYNPHLNQFTWTDENGQTFRVFTDSENPYYLSDIPKSNSQRRQQNSNKTLIPSGTSSIIKDLINIGPKNIKHKISECQNILTFREQLQLPMTPLEISTCRNKLEAIKKIQSCYEKKNCSDVYKEITAQPAARYSFVSLFESGIQMSDPQKRIGAIMAADSAASWSGNGLAIAYRRNIASIAGKVGLRFTTVFAIFNALSALTKPMWFAVLDFDRCGENGFNDNQKRSINDCIGQQSRTLQNVFSNEILKAIENSDAFFNTVAKQKEGLVGRVACYTFEAMYNDWQQVFNEYATPTCQGRTLSFANGNNYLIAQDQHVYRHLSIEQTIHFYPNSEALIEERNTGLFHPIVSINQAKTQTNRKESASLKSNEVIVPQRLIEEQTMVQTFFPNIDRLMSEGTCNTKSNGEKNLSDQ